jgi:hypothetical protein
MSTLHIDLSLGLSVDKTRNKLGSYSRGCNLSNFINYMPKIEFAPEEFKYFDVSNSSTFIFLSNYFGDEKPFTINLITTTDEIVTLEKCNMLLYECEGLKGIKITNTLKVEVFASIIK